MAGEVTKDLAVFIKGEIKCESIHSPVERDQRVLLVRKARTCDTTVNREQTQKLDKTYFQFHFAMPHSMNASFQFAIWSTLYHIFWFFFLKTALRDL